MKKILIVFTLFFCFSLIASKNDKVIISNEYAYQSFRVNARIGRVEILNKIIDEFYNEIKVDEMKILVDKIKYNHTFILKGLREMKKLQKNIDSDKWFLYNRSRFDNINEYYHLIGITNQYKQLYFVLRGKVPKLVIDTIIKRENNSSKLLREKYIEIWLTENRHEK